MNLGFNPWIPVMYWDGTHREVSLSEAFAQGREIADLAARPHERIALMRLLVCVAQAALDGPEDEYGWADAAKDAPSRVAVYLEKWRPRFELFGEGPRHPARCVHQAGSIRVLPDRVQQLTDGGGGPRLVERRGTGGAVEQVVLVRVRRGHR